MLIIVTWTSPLKDLSGEESFREKFIFPGTEGEEVTGYFRAEKDGQVLE